MNIFEVIGSLSYNIDSQSNNSLENLPCQTTIINDNSLIFIKELKWYIDFTAVVMCC